MPPWSPQKPSPEAREGVRCPGSLPASQPSSLPAFHPSSRAVACRAPLSTPLVIRGHPNPKASGCVLTRTLTFLSHVAIPKDPKPEPHRGPRALRAMTTPERGPQETLRHHGRAGSEHRRGRRAHARPGTGARPCVRQPWVFARGAVAREESVAARRPRHGPEGVGGGRVGARPAEVLRGLEGARDASRAGAERALAPPR